MRGETWKRTLGLVDLLVGICSAQNSKYITSSLYAVLLAKRENAKKFGIAEKVRHTHKGSLLLHFKTFERRNWFLLFVFSFVLYQLPFYCVACAEYFPGAFRCAARAPRLWSLETRETERLAATALFCNLVFSERLKKRRNFFRRVPSGFQINLPVYVRTEDCNRFPLFTPTIISYL
jgi:hypothetical protein